MENLPNIVKEDGDRNLHRENHQQVSDTHELPKLPQCWADMDQKILLLSEQEACPSDDCEGDQSAETGNNGYAIASGADRDDAGEKQTAGGGGNGQGSGANGGGMDPGVPELDDYLGFLDQEEQRKEQEEKEKSYLHRSAPDLADDVADKVTAAAGGEITVSVLAISNRLHGCFWSGSKSKLFMLNNKGDLIQFVEAQCQEPMTRTFGEIVSYAEVADAIGRETKDWQKTAKKCVWLAHKLVLDEIKYSNQRESIEMRVDMFASVSRIEVCDQIARIVFAHKRLPSGDYSEHVIDDYKSHFKEIDDFIDMLVWARMASDRKLAYLWMHCETNWGKGFLLGALDSLGLVVELSVSEVEKIFTGGAVGRTMADFVGAFCIAVDEFKGVNSELKQLQNHLVISPKYQLSAKVEIFSKIFLSAEGVSSLAGEHGVEDQFANRFALIRGYSDLEKRHVFAEVGKFQYMKSVRNYIAQRINNLVDMLVDIGHEDATEMADRRLAEFHQKHAIDCAYNRISNSIHEVAEEISDWVKDVYESRQKRNFDKHSHDVMQMVGESVIKFQSVYYLQNSSKIVGFWLSHHVDKSEIGTLGRKKSEIIELISEDGKGRYPYWIGNGGKKQIKAVRLK